MEDSVPLVLIVDDDSSVCRSLSRLIRTAEWDVRAFSCAQEFMEGVPTGATCVLLDVQMPGMTGVQLHDWMNDKGMSLPVIYLTGHDDVPTSVAAMKRGAMDFLLKPIDAEVLLGTVRRAIDLQTSKKSDEAGREEIKERHACLTPRERQVMGQVIGGRLNKQIAVDLGISLKTVKVHRARAMEKMGVRSVAALVHACYTAGINAHVR